MGHHRYKRMPFGFCNAPAIFQRGMDQLLREELDENIVMLMIDDILIASKTEEEHKKHVKRVVLKLTSANLQLNWKKCIWFSDTISYAGHRITKEGITLLPKFSKKLSDIPRPKNRQ